MFFVLNRGKYRRILFRLNVYQGIVDMPLRTKRLKIVPLNLDQFKLLLKDKDKMEASLGLKPSSEMMDEHTQQAMQGLYKEALKNKKNHLWYTNWQIILKDENVVIGSACFKGQPNENGEVELGYGINESFRNKGYMTEAAKALYQWALELPHVSCVTAETEKTNEASHKVLEKCGLEKFKETDEGYLWRRTKEGKKQL